MKKIIAIALVCIMVAALLPVAVFADEAVEISTADQFYAIKDNLGGSYKLTADISVTVGLSYRDEGAKFSGTFDGNGHTVTIATEDAERARTALFCSVDGATIKNLTVKGTMSSNGNSTAGVIGTVVGSGATLENVTNEVSFSAPNSGNGQGGIIGAVEGGTVTLTGCVNKGDIHGNFTGGIVGAAHAGTVKMINCVNEGDILGEVVGGFVGAVQNNDTTIIIENGTNEGNVECNNYFADYRGAGGFVGRFYNGWQNLTISGSENKGNVTANYVVANAFVGHNNIDDSHTFSITDTTNSGVITSGGLVLDADLATARDQGIWGGAYFGFDHKTLTVSGSPNFHALPNLNGYTAYINGTEATDKLTMSVVEGGNRQVNVSFDISEVETVGGFAAVTIVWSNGRYSTFGTGVPAKADFESYRESVEILGKYEEAAVDTSSVTSENPLLRDGWDQGTQTPHGSEGNLFDADNTNKYEGWKLIGTGSVIINFKLTEAAKVACYALGTGNDDYNFPDRQPVEWKLWGSVNGEDYVELDHVSADLPNLNNKLSAYEIEPTNDAYQYFKLEIIKFASEEGRNDGGVYVQLGEIKIYKACEHTFGDPVVEDATCTKDGSSTKTCTKCGATEVEVIESEGHNYVDGVCTVCGKSNPQTGDAASVLLLVSFIALVLTAAVVFTKRRIQT